MLGVQLFKGSLLYRCHPDNATFAIDGEDATVCAPPVAGEPTGCDAGSSCLYYGENPVHGTISFDSIGWAWITLFQCVTMEGWVDVMYMEMAAVSPFASIVYFVSLVLLGSFYLLNLFLAVLYDEYTEGEEREKAEKQALEDTGAMELEQARFILTRTLTLSAQTLTLTLTLTCTLTLTLT